MQHDWFFPVHWSVMFGILYPECFACEAASRVVFKKETRITSNKFFMALSEFGCEIDILQCSVLFCEVFERAFLMVLSRVIGLKFLGGPFGSGLGIAINSLSFLFLSSNTLFNMFAILLCSSGVPYLQLHL